MRVSKRVPRVDMTDDNDSSVINAEREWKTPIFGFSPKVPSINSTIRL